MTNIHNFSPNNKTSIINTCEEIYSQVNSLLNDFRTLDNEYLSYCNEFSRFNDIEYYYLKTLKSISYCTNNINKVYYEGNKASISLNNTLSTIYRHLSPINDITKGFFSECSNINTLGTLDIKNISTLVITSYLKCLSDSFEPSLESSYWMALLQEDNITLFPIDYLNLALQYICLNINSTKEFLSLCCNLSTSSQLYFSNNIYLPNYDLLQTINNYLIWLCNNYHLVKKTLLKNNYDLINNIFEHHHDEVLVKIKLLNYVTTIQNIISNQNNLSCEIDLLRTQNGYIFNYSSFESSDKSSLTLVEHSIKLNYFD